MIKMLLVDDEPNVLAGLRRMLRGYRGEWDMTFCESGAAALGCFEEEPRDVVVSDMRMPGMDGAELLERIRERWPGTARIVLSGHSDQEMTLRSVGPAHQYLSKPCDPESLRSAIESVVSLQRTLASEPIRRLVAGIDGLPTLPSVYVELVEELASPSASVERVGAIVGRDVGLTAKILQLVNSSFFGLPVRVRDVSHAVALLGLGAVRPLVLSTCVFRQYEDRDLGGLPLGRHVNHALRVGMLARDIAAEHADPETVDDALLAGLLHDVGRLVLAQSRPADYARLLEEVAAGGDLHELEALAFDAGHAEVGGYLLGMWGLPTALVEAVGLHHTPGRSPCDSFSLVTAVHAAEALTEQETSMDTRYLDEIAMSSAPARWAELVLDDPITCPA